MTQVTVQAPAKVNLYLEVLRKRPDGYHDLLSVMQALDLSDAVTLAPRESGVSVTCDDPRVPTGEGNIAYRAAEAYIKVAGISSGVGIHIEKRVPMAAGLGGGSSDAAAVLRGMGLLTGARVPEGRLLEVAARLGADVPFFLRWPCAVAEGIGERLTELPGYPETWLVLVNPGFAVSTAWVYKSLNLGLTTPDNNTTLRKINAFHVEGVFPARHLHNDLERVTVVEYPRIEELKGRLAGEGALGVLMSGSGPTVFGVFASEEAARKASSNMAEPGLLAIPTKTISAWPTPVVSSSSKEGPYGGDRSKGIPGS